MAKAMNCETGPTPSPCNQCERCKEITNGIAMDVFEIDGASNRGIDEVRELRENTKYMPSQSRYKVYIIDEVHMLTDPAFNALLKTLEEPPGHVLFFFATTEPHKLPITIRSRCQRHNFKRIAPGLITTSLERICREVSFSISDIGLRLISAKASGSMRDALSLLDQVMTYGKDGISDQEVLESLGTIDQDTLCRISAAVFAGDAFSALHILEGLYNQGHDLKQVYAKLLGHFRNLLILKIAHDPEGSLEDLSADDLVEMNEQVKAVSMETVHQMFSLLFEIESTIRFSSQPKIALEAILIKLSQAHRVSNLDQIIGRLHSLAHELGEKGPMLEDRHPKPRRQSEETTDQATETVKAKPYGSLRQTWQDLLSAFGRESKPLVPFLEKAELMKIGEDFLEIAVQENSFFTSRLKDERTLDIMREVCRSFFRRDMQINLLEKAEQDSQLVVRESSPKGNQLKRDALNHPVVTDALEVFNGKVVDVKIL
jgi:DNA polymerase-3 subunit gamma/tau